MLHCFHLPVLLQDHVVPTQNYARKECISNWASLTHYKYTKCLSLSLGSISGLGLLWIMCFHKITPCCDLALKLSLQKYLTKEVRWEEQGANDWYLGMPCPILVALLTYLMSAHSYLFTQNC